MTPLQRLKSYWKKESVSLEQIIDNKFVPREERRAAAILLGQILIQQLLLKKRSSKRRRSSPKSKQSNVRKADVARSAKRRTE
jgi:hypothetical protein